MVLATIEFMICALAVYIAVYVRFDGQALTQVELASYNINSPVATAILFGLVMPLTIRLRSPIPAM